MIRTTNHIYTPGQEKVDFYDSLARPAAQQGKAIRFSLFTEKSIDSTAATAPPEVLSGKAALPRQRKKKRKKKTGRHSRVLADTTHKSGGTVELAQPLIIALFRPLSAIDSSRIYLSYDDKGIDVKPPHHLTVDSNQILIHTQWQPEQKPIPYD